MTRASFWLRWSLRDFLRRWVQVVVTALVIAIGVAVFAGMGGLREWRENSATASFQKLRFHDVRATLAEGAYTPQGSMLAALRALKSSGVVTAGEERLIVPTQVDAKPLGRDILTPGRVIGIAVEGNDRVDLLHTSRGRTLRKSDAGRAVAVLDRSYSNFFDLPASGDLQLAGGESIRYVGQGQTPQYFLITSETGFGGESTLAVLYTTLRTAQQIAGHGKSVNEIEVLLRDGVDQHEAAAKIERAINSAVPGGGVQVTLGVEEQTHQILYRDAKNDQRMMSFFGLLVLLGACISAFNLVGRVVEAERREIGIGMALGVPTRLLALRPLLLGAEIALLGTLLGGALAVYVAGMFASVYKQFLPLPVFTDPLSVKVFLTGAAVGFALPFAATVWPVWRGVRVQPIEAIRVGARSAGGGMVRAATRIRLPGGTLTQMPWRNTSRTPRRTLLAVIGLGAVVGCLIAFVGIIDSFNRTIDVSAGETSGSTPNRVNVFLNRFEPVSSRQLRSLHVADGVAATETRLDLVGSIGRGSRSVPVLLSTQQIPNKIWTPAIDRGSLPRGPTQIAIAPKAAEDLGVKVGDRVALQLVARSPSGGPALRQLDVTISGLTADPFRAFAYADSQLTDAIGFSGLANAAHVLPKPGVSQGSVQRKLAQLPVVATTRPVTADTDALADTIDQFKGIIQVAAGATLALAILMAFNLAGISLEERRREYATMFAFGVPVRRGVSIAATENLIVGVIGTLLGIGIGLLTVEWIIGSLMAETWPEIGLIRHLSTGSAVVVFFVGIVAVAVTPVLLARRLVRMDLPSTLRVVE